MPGINFLAVVVAAALAFVASAVWYIVFGKQLATVSAAFAQGLQKRQPWKLLGVMAQSLVLAYLLGLVGKVDWLGALGVGVLLWIGLAAMQWVGSLMWENVPVKMAAIHAGDWLLKLVLTAVIVGAWPREHMRRRALFQPIAAFSGFCVSNLAQAKAFYAERRLRKRWRFFHLMDHIRRRHHAKFLSLLSNDPLENPDPDCWPSCSQSVCRRFASTLVKCNCQGDSMHFRLIRQVRAVSLLLSD